MTCQPPHKMGSTYSSNPSVASQCEDELASKRARPDHVTDEGTGRGRRDELVGKQNQM